MGHITMRSITALVFLVHLSGSLGADLLTFVDNPPVGIKDIKPCQSELIKSCSVVEVNFDALQEKVVNLPGDVILTFLDALGEGSYTFIDNTGTEATFTSAQDMNGDLHAIGNVNFGDGRDFMLEPCSDFPGCHVWMETDRSKLKIDPEPVMDVSNTKTRHAERTALVAMGRQDTTTVVTYSVMFWYTKEFADVTTDIPLFISQVIAETNQGYINSKVPFRVKTQCIKQVDFAEENDGRTMLRTFIASKPAKDLLNTADVAHLFVSKSNLCGIASFDSFGSKTNFGLTSKPCALNIYTPGHEIGHNFGLTHDKHQGPNYAYSYGLGHHIPGTNKMTIMAYPHEGNTVEINYYSAPNVYYNGILTGSELLNNARVLREHRFAVAATGDESGSCSSGGSSGSGSTGTVTSENYPSNYDNSLDKTYNIEVGSDKRIKITFDDLDIESHASCGYDYVMIKDSNGAALVGKTCGTTKPGVVTSTTNKVEVIFHSDGSETNKGFKLTWVEVPGVSGTIMSENYPSNYDNNLDKTYNIEVGSGKRIKISFDDLDIENEDSCFYDYVTVKDSNGAVLVGKTCGTTKPEVVTSTTNKVDVIFHSDGSVTNKGFKLTWVEVPGVSGTVK